MHVRYVITNKWLHMTALKKSTVENPKFLKMIVFLSTFPLHKQDSEAGQTCSYPSIRSFLPSVHGTAMASAKKFGKGDCQCIKHYSATKRTRTSRTWVRSGATEFHSLPPSDHFRSAYTFAQPNLIIYLTCSALTRDLTGYNIFFFTFYYPLTEHGICYYFTILDMAWLSNCITIVWHPTVSHILIFPDYTWRWQPCALLKCSCMAASLVALGVWPCPSESYGRLPPDWLTQKGGWFKGSL